MKNSGDKTVQNGVQRTRSASLIMIGMGGVSAIVTTFLLANSPLSTNTKAGGFGGIVVCFLLLCILAHWRQESQERERMASRASAAGVENALKAFDEMAEIFTGSFRRSDVFRLIFGRLQQMLLIDAAELLLLDETRYHLVVNDVEGFGDEGVRRTVQVGEGLAGDCFASSEVRIGKEISVSGKIMSAAAIPLRHGAGTFGVLQLYLGNGVDDISDLEVIGNKVSPLILSSISFERSLSNALTDATTDLPNERAFHLILENQVAESQRKGDERPLTILAIDIKNFGEINKRFGHIAGDRGLNFAATTIKDSLRQMDFFARSRDDEFLVVLPTATRDKSEAIVDRIQAAFSGQRLNVTENDSIEVGLNFGWAAFGADGETPDQLLRTARVRKAEAKSNMPGKVLWFPQEFAS